MVFSKCVDEILENSVGKFFETIPMEISLGILEKFLQVSFKKSPKELLYKTLGEFLKKICGAVPRCIPEAFSIEIKNS